MRRTKLYLNLFFFYRHGIHLGLKNVIHNIDNKLKDIYQLCKLELLLNNHLWLMCNYKYKVTNHNLYNVI